MKDIKYFREEEFKCKCCGKVVIDYQFVKMLDQARELAGTPFVITSGFRCPNHNKAVGGVSNSSHTLGLGVDISVNNSNRFRILSALVVAGFTRC